MLGRPKEYFNGQGRRLFDWPDYPDDPEAQLAQVLVRGTTPNGVYGLKLFPDQADARRAQWPTRLPALGFVHLERRDLLGQALSLARADQTGRYRSTQIPSAEPVYDRAAILVALQRICRDHARWRLHFALNAIQPVHLVYEDMLADPEGAVDRVGALVGLERHARVDPAAVDLCIQRDDLTVAWRARFLAEAETGELVPL